MGSRMSGEHNDWRNRTLPDDTERRRRVEAEALAELARLVEAAEPAFRARLPVQRPPAQNKRRA